MFLSADTVSNTQHCVYVSCFFISHPSTPCLCVLCLYCSVPLCFVVFGIRKCFYLLISNRRLFHTVSPNISVYFFTNPSLIQPHLHPGDCLTVWIRPHGYAGFLVSCSFVISRIGDDSPEAPVTLRQQWLVRLGYRGESDAPHINWAGNTPSLIQKCLPLSLSPDCLLFISFKNTSLIISLSHWRRWVGAHHNRRIHDAFLVCRICSVWWGVYYD